MGNLISARVKPSVPFAEHEHRGTRLCCFALRPIIRRKRLNAMRENPTTNRREAVEQLVEAAGGKVIAMYGTMRNGPGAMLIFDVTDPASAPPIAGIIASSGAVQNLQFSRLATMEEVTGYRRKAQEIRGAYKAPGS